MKKIALFVEGQTELIFVERLLNEIAGQKTIQIERRAARGSEVARRVHVHAKEATTGATYFALIVDSGSDSTVASDVREQYDALVKAGYVAIVGIRDVYPKQQSDIPKLERFLYHGLKTKPIHPNMLLAVMEVECWFLGEHTHFERIDASLTCALIQSKFGFDPSATNLEARVHPAEDLHLIYQLAGKAYRKDRKRVQRTVDALDTAHLYLEVPERVASLKSLVSIIDAFLT